MWKKHATLPWTEPLRFAQAHASGEMAFLYSGLEEPFTGGRSYLFLDARETIHGSAWDEMPTLPETADGLPLWVGYLGYGMRDAAVAGLPSPITLPDFSLTRYGQLYLFDHKTRAVLHYVAKDAAMKAAPQAHAQAGTPTPPTIHGLKSNLSRAEYEAIVSRTIEQIRAGNFYQANITRKFYGSFDHTPDSWQIFEALCAASPAPYSAYIRHGSVAVLSSSPECLLTVDSRGTMTTRPIKGSARRDTDETSDAAIRDALKASVKNHAENLMIVDLMRNDLSRVSEPQTVNVVEQSALYSYRTIHHLISTIQSKKLTHVGVYDAVRACFPAGSMTGAPKIAAIAWCEAQEKMERGLYSGAIGWFGGGNTCDLSVVIRTLIIDGECFEFQVGGGIVADSTPTDEWRETMTKARGIIAALGLGEEDLARL